MFLKTIESLDYKKISESTKILLEKPKTKKNFDRLALFVVRRRQPNQN